MANITGVAVIKDGYNAPYGAVTVTYGPMQNGDIGVPPSMNLDVYSDVSFQATGTFGTGGSVAVEGSNDGTNFVALHNAQGTTIALTAASITAVLEAVNYTRPHVTAGDGNTTLTVTGFYRRTY
jgi:hypothetical protein